MKFVDKNGAGMETLYAIRHHASLLGDVGTQLLAMLAHVDIPGEYGTSRGGANSWYVQVDGQPKLYLWGNKDTGEIEVRDKSRGSFQVLRVLTSPVQAMTWVRKGCPV